MSHAVRPCTEKCRPASAVGNSDHSGAHCYLLILGTLYIQRIDENREEPRFHSRDKKSEMLYFLLILLYFLKICWVGWGG